MYLLRSNRPSNHRSWFLDLLGPTIAIWSLQPVSTRDQSGHRDGFLRHAERGHRGSPQILLLQFLCVCDCKLLFCNACRGRLVYRWVDCLKVPVDAIRWLFQRRHVQINGRVQTKDGQRHDVCLMDNRDRLRPLFVASHKSCLHSLEKFWGWWTKVC